MTDEDRIRCLTAELQYYRGAVEQCGDIIKQLHEGEKPGEIVYIHPYDLMVLLNEAQIQDCALDLSISHDDDNERIITIAGKKFRQSVYMPQVFGKVK